MQGKLQSVIVELLHKTSERSLPCVATITQDMNYKQSLMKYATAHGVSKASRKYNRSRSYIYFWLKRWDGSVESLRPESRRPHHHPNQHTPAELKLIHDMRRRNPRLGMVELWYKLRKKELPLNVFRPIMVLNSLTNSVTGNPGQSPSLKKR